MTDEALQGVERQILVTMMLEPEQSVGIVTAALSAGDFVHPVERSVYSVIYALFVDGKTITPLTVRAEVGMDQDKYLVQLVETYIPQPYAMEEYCQIVRSERKLRSAQAIGSEIYGAKSFDEVSGSISKLNDILSDGEATQTVSLAEAIKDLMLRKSSGEKPVLLDWGVPTLDAALNIGLGKYVVLAASPGIGKTALALQFAIRIAKTHRVGYFSYEPDRDEIASRAIAHVGHVSWAALQRNNLNEADWAGMAEASTKISALPFDIVPYTGHSASDIVAYTVAHQYDVIVVDYLQQVEPEVNANRTEQVSVISRRLQGLTRKHGVTVIALSQLSRAEKDKGRPVPPTLQSLRESGQIEQDADAVLLMYLLNFNNYLSPRVMKLAKNRNGLHKRLYFAFDGAYQTMNEISEDEAMEMAKEENETKAMPRPKPESKAEAYRRVQREIRDAGKQQITFEEIEDDGKSGLPF